MRTSQTNMDSAIGKVLNAKRNLKEAQTAARAVLLNIIHEKKNVQFMPSPFWKERIGEGPAGMMEALDEESVNISYDRDLEEQRSGYVTAIREMPDGSVAISVMDADTKEDVTIGEDDTWDMEMLLEFIHRFGE